jgi:hypothetical protein
MLAATVLLFSLSQSKVEIPPAIANHLETPKWDSTPSGFRIMALSFVADGCAAQAHRDETKMNSAHDCIEKVFNVAEPLFKDERIESSRYGLLMTHVNLILGASDATGPCLNHSLHQQISKRLSELSLGDEHAHAPSYAKAKERWPADQAATLASLARYDHFHHGTLHEKPVERWVEIIRAQGLDLKRELPISEITHAHGTSKYPRGCAQSYMTRYVSEFNIELSSTWYNNYKKHFSDSVVGQKGFREWPRGVNVKADIDSGPIVFGIGAAASAFGIGAAKSQCDPLGHTLESTANLVLGFGVGGKQADTILAQSIRFAAHWQPCLASEG